MSNLPETPEPPAEQDVSATQDEPVVVDALLLEKLVAFRAEPRLQYYPYVDIYSEKARLSGVANGLIDTLITLLPSHPNRAWIRKQFRQAFDEVKHEELEGKEHFQMEMDQLTDILGIEESIRPHGHDAPT